MSHNDITGDKLASRPNSKEYSDNYDRIFRKMVEPGYNAVKLEHKLKKQLKEKDANS